MNLSNSGGRPEVIRIGSGLPVNCYLIRDQGVVLVDCSMPGRSNAIEKKMAQHGVKPGDLTLILVTHAHADHAGSAADLKASTGAPIALHSADQPWLETGTLVVPPAVTKWGKVVGWMTRQVVPLMHLPPAEVDIPLSDEDLNLEPYGVRGMVRSTPGHTPCSVSVLLPNSIISGDMAMNGFPFRRGAGLPFAADDLPAVVDTWRSLFDRHQFDTIYPGHGAAFRAEVMKREIDSFPRS